MRRSGEQTGIALGLIEALGRLSQHRLLDRLLRGRASIALVAFALIGIVTMQLGLLKLNAGIGRALEHEALLQRENAALSIENSEMAAGERVELQAAHLGMGLVSPGALHFLAARPTIDASRGAAALSTPVATFAAGAATATPSGSTVAEGSSGATTGVAANAGVEAPGGASGTTAETTASTTSGTSSSTSTSTVAASAASEAHEGGEAKANVPVPAAPPVAQAGGVSSGPQG